MAVTVYKSTDASAPVLSGTVGALLGVLDKCLVAGYGSKAAAGWTKPYTGTNTAVFKQGGGNGFYLDVNDNAVLGGAVANETNMRGYETMTAVATGTGSFPTSAQIAGGIFVLKSITADATARAWTVIADDRTFYLFTQYSSPVWSGFGFGDFYSYVAGTDGFRTFLMGRAVTGTSSTNENADKVSTDFAAGTAGHYVPRSYTGLGGSVNVAKSGDHVKAGGASSGFLRGVMALPNPVDGRVWVAPVFVSETTAVVRGKIRGFMHYLHTVASFADQDTVTGAGVYSGHTFLLFKTTGNSAAYCVDITGPWGHELTVANIGTQTTNEETGGPYATANAFSYRYPVKAWYPSGSATADAILEGAISVGGGGASIYTRPG